MFILRELKLNDRGFHEERNLMIGDEYSLHTDPVTVKELWESFVTPDLVGKAVMPEELKGILECTDKDLFLPLYSGTTYYIMSPNGETFSRLILF